MKRVTLAAVGSAFVAVPLVMSGGAYAVTAPIASTCVVGQTTHTEYKWVPDKVNQGPTQWTTTDAAANAHRDFSWKGAPVSYHRDGTKSTQVVDTSCPAPAGPAADIAVQAPAFAVNTQTCSVTVPYIEGVETRLYGVNGYPETTPITQNTVVSASLNGEFASAPQFWIGYTAKPGYVLTGTGTGHIDFYNGDYTADCDVTPAI